ncbi:MAG: phosphoribosylformylglycinamidine synthase [Clostridiales bacterium]|nr:phosphoribosylformylglycinamidine synthase [Clostridiales bacterium]
MSKNSVYRIYVEKKEEFAVESKGIFDELVSFLQIKSLQNVKIINRYDVDNISKENFEKAIPTVFSEPPVDNIFFELPKNTQNEVYLAVEFLPGQFDQRADSAAQCIQLLCGGERPRVKSAKIYILSGKISDAEMQKIKDFLINPVESRECGLDAYQTLEEKFEIPNQVDVLDGFILLDENGLKEFVNEYSLAMDVDDVKFCQEYFKSENRNPTITEIRMIDTYWSDHCRHTTFLTEITDAKINADYINKTFITYKLHKKELGRENKPITLMDIATAAARKLKKDGFLPDLDESEEINACSVKIKVDVDGKMQDWLLMFKNETHNHPTEIEPFGGAATCLGGAIRDPLSGRAYVYQAMRITGASDPLLPVEETIKGKLPPKKITTTAAAGYSSYGNQIGLATGLVNEIYHKGYMAKRMELGAVIAAAPAENVVRERPIAGDKIILLGGRTGRDGCGGATGSSKSHNLDSLEKSGAEVQKGNAPEERKIQRLFRNKNVTRLIKRCNDFGAGGVSVAIGELADGLDINLDVVPKKYEGLDGTELAISESQERMAVVVADSDVEKFISFANEENLEATVVAEVKAEPRLLMTWKGKEIVNLSREFLNSNGAKKFAEIQINKPEIKPLSNRKNTKADWINLVSDLNVASQKGLLQRFDSSIGTSTVLMPFSGRHQATPIQSMAAKIPVLDKQTTTSSIMSWGFNPFLSEQSPYHGAQSAVIESVAKIIATGGDINKCWLTFQEYFERTKDDPIRWGKPFAALLGAYKAQTELKLASIGGKDSMSGTFEEIDVPPTLVSIAVSVSNQDNIISSDFKLPFSKIAYIKPRYDENNEPVYESVKEVFLAVQKLIREKKVLSSWAVGFGGIAEAVFKMSLGNKIGAKLKNINDDELFNPVYGSFILELSDKAVQSDSSSLEIIGETISEYKIICNDIELDISELEKSWSDKLEPVFKTKTSEKTAPKKISFKEDFTFHYSGESARPQVLIPVFPGTNGEYDMKGAFEREGAKGKIFVIKNLTANDIKESVDAFAKAIEGSNIIAIPGGFSGGDEPEGSAKFIAAFFRNPKITDAVHNMLYKRDGLMLGICNGFQALIKLGLVPHGKIVHLDENSPTLTFNEIGRHQNQLVHTRIASTKSPWLSECKVDEVYTIPISHGEGRFVAEQSIIDSMIKNGQIATQYVDLNGSPTMDIEYNPNASVCAIEGILSIDGRILGKMGHSERYADGCFTNVDGKKQQPLFKGAVKYFNY